MEDNIDLKIKFVQTDLSDKGFIYKKMMQYGNVFNPSLIYENSDYISKLHFINNYADGLIVKNENNKNNRKDKLNCVLDNEDEDGNNCEDCDETVKDDNSNHSIEDYFICYDSEDEVIDSDDEYYDDYDSDDFEEYYDEDENGEDIYSNELKIEFNTTGRLSVSKDQITISYDEGDLIGFDNAMVNIMMDSKNPDIITIQKDNLIKSTLTLEKNKKSISDYDHYFSDVTVAVKTLEMMNNMTKKGGEINLLYTVETNGSPTEMVSYSLSAEIF